MKSLCFATNNEHKLEEIRALLGPFFQVKSLQEIGCFEELPETQATIEGNSRQKAEYVFLNYSIPCFADDTGLEVEALRGEPGVYSARYAGDHKNSNDNIDLLLIKLENESNKRARFKSVITLADTQGIFQFEGIINGEIIGERRGTLGFGYDPVFLPHGFKSTFGEMTRDEKNLISHRAIAVKKLINFLRERYT